MTAQINRRHLLGGLGAVLSVAFLPGCSSLPVIPKLSDVSVCETNRGT